MVIFILNSAIVNSAVNMYIWQNCEVSLFCLLINLYKPAKVAQSPPLCLREKIFQTSGLLGQEILS